MVGIPGLSRPSCRRSFNFWHSSERPQTVLVKRIREIEICKGKISYVISKSSSKNLNGRKSLYVIKDIKKGEIINAKNIKSIRPSFGLHPKYFKKILGKKVKKNCKFGQPVKLKDIVF